MTRRRRDDADFAAEVRAHLALEAEQRMREGESPEDAHAAARRAFGSVATAQERFYESRRVLWLDRAWQDLRYALRQIRRAPGLPSVVVLTLALGIGALTTVFSVVDTVLLEPLPYAHPERLVALWNRWEGRTAGAGSVSPAEYFDYLDRLRSFDAFGVYATDVATLAGDAGEPERVPEAQASAGALEALGVRPVVGRLIAPRDDHPQADVVVIGAELWRRRYAASSDVLGRRIVLNGTSVTVIGVLPPGFRLPDELSSTTPAQLVVPLGLARDRVRVRGSHFLSAVGRARPGVTVARANAEVAAIAADFTNRFPKDYPTRMHFGAMALPLHDSVVQVARPSLMLLLGAASLVLVIACVNAASLLLARSESRRAEIAVRTALGASRGRLLRQLLVESLLLAVLAGGAGIAFAVTGTHALVLLHPVNLPRLAELSVDGRALGFGLAITLLSGIAFGLMPALQVAGSDVQSVLRGGGRGSTGGLGPRVRRALVIGEIVMAIVLLFGAGLLTKSLLRLLRVDPGFTVENILTVPITLPDAAYARDEEVIAFYQQAAERLRALPGVRAAGAVAGVPLVAPRGDIGIELEGQPIAPGATRPKANWQIVTPGYFRAIGMRLLAGREIEASDRATTVGVAVVNETMARRYWPAGGALGHRFKLGGGARPDTVTVIGVVRDVRQAGLGATPDPEMYLAHTQFRFWGGGGILRSLTLTVSATAEPTQLGPPVRQALRAMAPGVPLGAMRTMEEVRGASVAQPRFMMLLLLASSLLALVVAVVGLYGVVAYSVAQRRREFSVRIALGASSGAIERLVLSESAAITVAGVAIGVPIALGFARLLTGFLFEVHPTDVALLATVTGMLALVAALASYLPARRAARSDPLAALRID